MPAVYSHYRLGQKVIEQLNNPLKKIILNNQDLFNLGLHGPDILFYNRPYIHSKVNQLGSTMHQQKANNFFKKSLSILKETKSEAQFIYLCGFVCHFILDSNCHGYIDNIIVVTGITHFEIETELDRYLMLKDNLDPLTSPLTNHIIINEYIITNTGEEKLPFVIGGHPAFNCPLSDDEEFEDYRVVFDKPITRPCLRPDHHSGLVHVDESFDVMAGSDTLELRHDLFEEKDALIFYGCEAKAATMIGKNGKGIKIEFNDMNNLLIWSAVGNAPFVALEPWTGISSCNDEDDTFEKKRGMTVLNPNETISFRFKITMI